MCYCPTHMKKRTKQTILNIVIALVVLAVVGLMTRNAIIKSGARKAVREATGFDLEMGGVSANLLASTFEIKDLKLINPEDFPEETAVDFKQMFVSYDLKSFFTDEIHLREVILDVPRMVVVQKEDGDSNLKRLGDAGRGKDKGGQETPESKPGEPAPEEKAEKPAKKFRIDKLTLRLGAVEMHKYVQGKEKPDVQVHEMNLDRTYTDIRDTTQLATIFAMAMVEGVGAQALKGLGKILDENQGDLDKTGKDIERSVKDLGNQLKGLFNGK